MTDEARMVLIGGMSTDVLAAASLAKVLIVDDNPRVAMSLKMLLRDYDVTVTNDATDALARILAGGFDAVLCDLSMPKLSGPALFEQVRAQRPGLEGKLVFMTGGAFTPEAQNFLRAVPNPVLEKPFREDSLEAALARVGAYPQRPLAS